MGKKKVNSGCIYIKYIYNIKFSRVRLLKIILAPFALYLTLKAVICNPVTLQQVLCIPAFLGICSWAAHQAVWSWHCPTNSNDHILFLLQPGGALKHPDISSPVRCYLWFSKITCKQGKGAQHNRKAKRQRFCEMWPRSLQSVGLVTVSINVLWQLLLFMPGFKAWEKEAVRDGLGSQTGSVHWALKHLPECGGHWRAVQD